MAVERAGTSKLLDVLEHVAEGGIVIADAKLEPSAVEGADQTEPNAPDSAAVLPRKKSEPGRNATTVLSPSTCPAAQSSSIRRGYDPALNYQRPSTA
ncbi:MAG TPA: hypothetical protein VFO14_25325 [Vicinamibacterales bacterium]|nr:hypothetical protein [Vicinamibacterales bacterium]